MHICPISAFEFVTAVPVFCLGSGCEACRVPAFRLGFKPAPLALEREALTAGPPGKSMSWLLHVSVVDQ